MKKISSLIAVLSLLLISLTSCKANWFGTSIEVHWSVIVVPITLVLIISHVLIVTRKYKCSQCGAIFRPKWYEISSWIHMGSKRLVKCPKCKYKGFCKKE